MLEESINIQNEFLLIYTEHTLKNSLLIQRDHFTYCGRP